MKKRTIGPFSVNPIGLGCMNVSDVYGPPIPPQEGAKVLLRALDIGVDFFDTAALYGGGANETLIGETLSQHRSQFVLASKCGNTVVDGKRIIDGRPETIKATCEASLRRLRTDVIDLYYLHRRDFKVPIEDSVGALSDLVSEGKVRTIGLSEVSAETIKTAHAIHPITAVQSEYSLWTRDPEIAVLSACKSIGATLVAFSPLARAFLCGKITDPATQLVAPDFRFNVPRFSSECYPKNLELLKPYKRIAEREGCTPSQLALAWVLNKHQDMIAIPGTRSPEHLEENHLATNIHLNDETIAELDSLINEKTVHGERYNEVIYQSIDTERFPH